MSVWRCYHLDETITAITVPDNHRFFVRLREPPGETRHPIEFYRWNLKDAQEAADNLVQAYYPHDCNEQRCGEWRKSDS